MILNIELAPTHKYKFGNYILLWFKKSNTYNVIDSNFYDFLEAYFKADNKGYFKSLISNYNISESEDDIFKSITHFLNDCNKDKEQIIYNDSDYIKKNTPISKTIKVFNQIVTLHFDLEIVQKTIFPYVSHLEVLNETLVTDINFFFYLDSGYLYLHQDDDFILKTPKLDYHVLQGKFIFRLICAIHNKKESDWLATFHACTIANEDSSILITGVSGKGKSTLSAILASSSFNLVADDVSPLSVDNLEFYLNPVAVSLKKGSFDTIKSIVLEFDNIPSITFNKSKGEQKYIPFKTPEKKHYPCKAIVLVNYKQNSETILKKAELPDVLKAFLLDSWISPKEHHAELFLQWLKKQQFYSLTYSNNNEAINTINQIFKD